MKIEKVNENQIRCTLTREDLADRELKISELAYGTEKAKSLFRDMMQQASYQFGFEAEDIPLMIEAIPLNSECIVLIITKVEDPDELDTRFSKFSPSIHDDGAGGLDDMIDELTENADEVMDLFKKLHEGRSQKGNKTKDNAPSETGKTSASEKNPSPRESIWVYSFKTLRDVMQAAAVLSGRYQGRNSLYKDEKQNTYILFLECKTTQEQQTAGVFHILSEYGQRIASPVSAGKAFFEEHAQVILKSNALQSLAEIK